MTTKYIQMDTDIKLVNKDGTLYFPDSVKDSYGDPGPMLVVQYDEGDADTVPWPVRSKKARKNLRTCIYDAIEMGWIKSTDRVTLPNGKPIDMFSLDTD